jgi:hypothetical protein
MFAERDNLTVLKFIEVPKNLINKERCMALSKKQYKKVCKKFAVFNVSFLLSNGTAMQPVMHFTLCQQKLFWMVDKQFYFVLSILQSKFHCIHLTIKE